MIVTVVGDEFAVAFRRFVEQFLVKLLHVVHISAKSERSIFRFGCVVILLQVVVNAWMALGKRVRHTVLTSASTRIK